MFRKIIISLILLSFYTNQASEARASSPSKAEMAEVYFSICQSTGIAAHADCVLRTQCSQRCIGCRKWDMLFSESKEACEEFKVNFDNKCQICEKPLLKESTPLLPADKK